MQNPLPDLTPFPPAAITHGKKLAVVAADSTLAAARPCECSNIAGNPKLPQNKQVNRPVAEATTTPSEKETATSPEIASKEGPAAEASATEVSSSDVTPVEGVPGQTEPDDASPSADAIQPAAATVEKPGAEIPEDKTTDEEIPMGETPAVEPASELAAESVTNPEIDTTDLQSEPIDPASEQIQFPPDELLTEEALQEEASPEEAVTEAPSADEPLSGEPQSAEASETEEVSETPASDETPAKPSIVVRVKSLAQRHGKLAGICCGSFLAGLIFSWCLPDAETESVAEVTEPEAAKYVAAFSRSNEPISPVAPHPNLEPATASLGKRLFNDPALSGNGRVACASCHNDSPQVSVDDKRDAPNLLNASMNFVQCWNGHVPTLEDQIDDHIQHLQEMNTDWERVVKYVTNEPAYARAFRASLGGNPTQARVQEAIATYTRSLVTVDSKFDRWLGGEESALTPDELSGYYSFKKFNCISCHQGPGVGGTMFQPLGAMKEFFTSQRDLTDADLGRFSVTEQERDKYVFRVPALRSSTWNAPYFHDGSVARLEDAVEAMIRYQVGEEPNAEEIRRITLFLQSLAGQVPEAIQ